MATDEIKEEIESTIDDISWKSIYFKHHCLKFVCKQCTTASQLFFCFCVTLCEFYIFFVLLLSLFRKYDILFRSIGYVLNMLNNDVGSVFNVLSFLLFDSC